MLIVALIPLNAMAQLLTHEQLIQFATCEIHPYPAHAPCLVIVVTAAPKTNWTSEINLGASAFSVDGTGAKFFVENCTAFYAVVFQVHAYDNTVPIYDRNMTIGAFSTRIPYAANHQMTNATFGTVSLSGQC